MRLRVGVSAPPVVGAVVRGNNRARIIYMKTELYEVDWLGNTKTNFWGVYEVDVTPQKGDGVTLPDRDGVDNYFKVVCRHFHPKEKTVCVGIRMVGKAKPKQSSAKEQYTREDSLIWKIGLVIAGVGMSLMFEKDELEVIKQELADIL